MKTRISASLLVLMLFALASCNVNSNRRSVREQAPQTDGGGTAQDGGGGETKTSSPELIKETVEKVRQYFVNEREGIEGAGVFTRAKHYSKDSEITSLLEKIESLSKDPKNLHPAILAKEIKNRTLYRGPWQYFDSTSFDFKTEDCLDANKEPRDAAVSKHDTSASICISVKRLTKVPPESLFKVLAGLLAHELAHMNGLSEEPAQKIHKHFADNFDLIFWGSGLKLKNSILEMVFQVDSDLYLAQTMVKGSVKGWEALAMRASGRLDSLRLLLNPGRMERGFVVATPGRANQVRELIGELDIQFRIIEGAALGKNFFDPEEPVKPEEERTIPIEALRTCKKLGLELLVYLYGDEWKQPQHGHDWMIDVAEGKVK